ncbi:MAG TPA: FHA domain-containing protein [Myxococcales bacterium]|nr:FHA domain-containing protein [Myxococcales bacterium]
MPAKNAKKKKPSEVEELKAKISKALGVNGGEAELRALRALADSLGLSANKMPAQAPAAAPAAAERPHTTPGAYLPQRLYLLMDGRGLDGRGMPQEVIDLPCIIGSSKKSSVWINSPQIETHHLRITHGDEGWVLEDLGSEHGTFFGDEKIKRRVIQDGDEYRLAGYLRLRTELK